MLLAAARNGYFNVCKWLLSHGCDKDINDLRYHHGNTVLHLTRDPEIVKLLLENGADPMILNDEGEPASLGVGSVMVDPRKELIHSRMLQNDRPDEFCTTLLRLTEKARREEETGGGGGQRKSKGDKGKRGE